MLNRAYAHHKMEDIHRDPYNHLLTQSEIGFAHNIGPRLALDSVAPMAAIFYYMSRSKELHRVRRLAVTPDLIFQLTWRAAGCFILSDFFVKRLVVNYAAMYQHKMAVNEVRKHMRNVPQAKPHLQQYQKPNSYFFV